MESFKKVALVCLNKIKAFAIGFASFLFVMLTCVGSFFVGTLAVFAVVACLFVKLLWPVFLMLVLLAGIGLMLGVIIV